jgi:hypothetical protein
MERLVGAIVIAGIALGAIALMAIGGGLLVLLAYGVGLLVNLVAHFEPFQVTVLSLAGIIAVGFWAVRIISGLVSFPSSLMDLDDDYDEDENEDEDDYDDDDADYVDEANNYPGVPRWRQPLKSVDFSKVGPDDRCPCGSGRKYKNCHGSKRGK